MMTKTLGLLILSEHHGAHLEALVAAARRKRITLHVHVSGDAVRLCLLQNIQSALAKTRMTICHISAHRLGLQEHLDAMYPGALTSSRRPPVPIHQCVRRMVL